MTKRLFFLFSLLAAITAYAQQWYPSHGVRGRDINSIVIFSRDNILMAGGNRDNDSIQSIFQSGNEGLFWNIVTDNISSWLACMAFRDSLHGVAAGFNGKIIKTSDGGANWSRVNSPTNDRHFNKIIFIDPLTAFIAGGWQSSDSIRTIMKSIDGGNTWNIVYDQQGYWLRSICFLDLQRGFAVGEYGTILKTTDGGASWLPLASPIQRDFNAIAFVNDSTGYIAGGKEANDSIRTILQTTDAGNTWTVLKDEPGGWLTDVYFLNRDTGYITGYQATLLKTTDGGNTWMQETVSTALGDEYFNTVRFAGKNFGVIGCRYGRVFVYTTSAAPQAQTTGHAINDSTGANLLGEVSTAGYPGQYWFTISTDSAFSSSGQTFPVDVQSDTMTPAIYTLNGLIPNILYYFYITAKTYAGTATGEALALFTYKDNVLVNTLLADQVQGTSARLNGEIDKLPLQSSVSFEYGLSPALGSEVTAMPAQIGDTLYYNVSATLNNLSPNTLYYFRIKTATEPGINFYGQVRQVYTGFPIPNWDFQIWQDDTVLLPYDWTIGMENFERVPGNTGDYALKLYKDNVALLGKLMPEGSHVLLYDGMPFNIIPDSLIVFLNYNIASGDTAWVLLQLSSSGTTTAFQFFPVAGSSGGDFARLSFKIDYNSPLTPDSLAIGIVSINTFDTIVIDYTDNLLIIDEISFSPAAPAVLNSGFENWFEYPYKKLESWDYLKYLYVDNILNGDKDVSQVFFKEPDDYAAEIRNIAEGSGRHYLQGSVKQSKSGPLFDAEGPSFPVYARHQTLNGFLEYYPVNGDSATITIAMYRAGTSVGNGSFTISDSITGFEPFSIPINYAGAQDPDSASIKIGISSAKGASRLIVDKLTFDGYAFIPGSQNPVILPREDAGVKIYPNPARQLVIVETNFPSDEEAVLQLSDLSGRIVASLSVPASQSRIEINTAGLHSNFYILRLISGDKILNRKIVVLN